MKNNRLLQSARSLQNNRKGKAKRTWLAAAAAYMGAFQTYSLISTPILKVNINTGEPLTEAEIEEKRRDKAQAIFNNTVRTADAIVKALKPIK